jgi:fumarate hydratase subunit alpha
VPICQDTGLAVVFVELGQKVHIVGGDFEEAINAGVRAAYLDGYMRCSVVGDPLFSRKNTGDNTPAVIHVNIVPGDRLRITAAPKGFGSENKSAIRMFTPAASPRDVSDFVVDTVLRAGGDPCPPVVVGVGIGGTFESAALDAKRALTLPTTYRNPDERYAELEDELLDRINATGIGPQGFGGRTTALAVNIIARPTHIAGLPVAVNVGCHVTRHAEGEL